MMCLLARGMAKKKEAPGQFDRLFAGGLFVTRVVSTHAQYGGLTGAVSLAMTGRLKGLQGVFDRVADAIIAETEKAAVAMVFASEVDEMDNAQVTSIARQLQAGEGLRKVPLFFLYASRTPRPAERDKPFRGDEADASHRSGHDLKVHAPRDR